MTQAPSKPALTLPEIEKREAEIHLRLAETSFVDFLDFVKIMEAPQAGAVTGGLIPFEKWPHIIELAEQLQRPWDLKEEGQQEEITAKDLHTVIGKSRQIGFSWLVAAFALWLVLFHKGAVVLMLSRGEVEAAVLLGKVKTIYDNLPVHRWKKHRKSDKRSDREFSFTKVMSSKVTALPSTEDAGSGEQATVVIQDEADKHPYLAANIGALQPTIAAGGQIIMGSTVVKRNMRSYFKGVIRSAPDNGFTKFFFGWTVRPGRDQKWYDQTKATIPDEELAEMTPDLFMEQEFPLTEEEMLAPARANAWFDIENLNQLQAFVQKPIMTLVEDDYRGVLCFYVHRTPRGRYSAGTDLGHGVGSDYSVTVVIDSHAGRVVADIMDNTIPPDEFIEESIRLLKVYNQPIWGIERNALGIEANDAAVELGYRRLYHRETARTMGAAHKKKAEPGFQTDGRNRFLLFGKLRQRVESGELIIPRKEGLDQFYSIMIDPKDSQGKPMHQLGAHDDYVIACGIANLMEEFAFARNDRPAFAPAAW